jgi:hypothetical protein
VAASTARHPLAISDAARRILGAIDDDRDRGKLLAGQREGEVIRAAMKDALADRVERGAATDP